jgi:protein dithiol oxidoreductase (disulfide-forming)
MPQQYTRSNKNPQGGNMKLVMKLFIALAMLCTIPAFADAELGKDYSLLQPPQPTNNANKVEVREFFFYGCIHCFHLHPLLDAWVKKKPKYVEMVYVPAIFNSHWEPMASTYYTLQLMGKGNQLDDALYNAWNRENDYLTEDSDIADFMAKHGVDRKKFSEIYHSFTVASEVARSKQMLLEYHINGTPTLVVDGKYVITGLQPDRTIQVLDEVVKMAHKDHSG